MRIHFFRKDPSTFPTGRTVYLLHALRKKPRWCGALFLDLRRIAYNSRLAVASLGRRPPLAVLLASKTSLRPSIRHASKAVCLLHVQIRNDSTFVKSFLMDLRRIELLFPGCKPGALPLSYGPRNKF